MWKHARSNQNHLNNASVAFFYFYANLSPASLIFENQCIYNHFQKFCFWSANILRKKMTYIFACFSALDIFKLSEYIKENANNKYYQRKKVKKTITYFLSSLIYIVKGMKTKIRDTCVKMQHVILLTYVDYWFLENTFYILKILLNKK